MRMSASTHLNTEKVHIPHSTVWTINSKSAFAGDGFFNESRQFLTSKIIKGVDPMKKIEACIRPEKLEDIKEALGTLQINGLSISEIVGCGNQKGWKEYIRGSEVDLIFLPKIRIEIVVLDEQVETVIEQICEKAFTGEVGDGKIFVSEIQDAVRIRTKERGISAIK